LVATDSLVHSDILVHWTGHDLDEALHPGWHEERSSKTPSEELLGSYVNRLLNILRHGFWMTDEPAAQIGGVSAPAVPRVCFTELRLSESRRHACRFGRLGIGVKRPYAFTRGGRPVVYYGQYDYGFGDGGLAGDVFLQACVRQFGDARALHFFKPMSVEGMDYEYYAESEWRILALESLLRTRLVTDPSSNADSPSAAYVAQLQPQARQKLRYLLPLDGWLAAVIYPSLSVKRRALEDARIREAIRQLKSARCRANSVEPGNWPVEMDLDFCRNL